MNRAAMWMCAATAAMAMGAFADDVWSGYRQLDWIETDGSNWIDTGVRARSGLVVSGRLRLLGADPGRALFGAGDANGANALALLTRETLSSAWNSLRVLSPNINSGAPTAFTATFNASSGPHKDYTYTFDDGSFTCSGANSGVPDAVAGDFESASSIFLGWMGGPGANGGSADYVPAPLMIYSFYIQDKATGEYIRQMVPARRNSDGAVGMLDTANGVFYAHCGARPFTAGAEADCVMRGAFMASGKCAALVVGGYAGSSALSKVPVLVRISASSIPGFSHSDTLAGGADVFFSSDAYGMERLACDIETWDTSGTSLAWVKVSRLSGKTTTFYMFWGSGSPVARPPSTEVWSGYVAVWHMNSYDAETGVMDETGHGFNATNQTGCAATAYTGKFGPSLRMTTRMLAPNYDRYVTETSVTNLMPDVSTISFWSKLPDGYTSNTYPSVLDKYLNLDVGSAKIRYGWLWQLNKSKTSLPFYYGNGLNQSMANSIADMTGNWDYMTARSDGYTHYSYYNGAQKASNNAGSKGYVAKNWYPVRFGHSAKATALDEVRISRECFSADRVKADYDMMNSASFVAASASCVAPGVVDVSGVPQNYGESTIDYGVDTNVVDGVAKEYSVPATIELSGADHRAFCDGWELSVLNAEKR